MGNPSIDDLPTGDVSALGLPVKRVAIPQEDITVEGQQQTEPQEEVVEAPEVQEPVEETAPEEKSVLAQYEELMDEEPEAPQASSEAKRIEQLESQLAELMAKKDEAIVAKADEQDAADDEIDLTSPVIQQHLETLRQTDPEEARRAEARIIEEKIKQETKKSTAALEAKYEAASVKSRMAEATRQAEAKVLSGLAKVAKSGGVEAELVKQFNETAPENRHLTRVGKIFLGDHSTMLSEDSVYRAIRTAAAEINDRVRQGATPTVEVNESTGVSPVSQQKSVAINQPEQELTPEEIELQENEAFADGLIERNKLPPELAFLKPLE